MTAPRLFWIFALCTGCTAGSLADDLRARISGFQGDVSLYAKNLDTSVSVGIHEAEPVRTASTIKLPIMVAVFDAVARGQARWSDRLTVTKAAKAPGSGIIASEIDDGVELPIADVMHLMIVLSDNTATNMILDRFTADAVNAYLDRIGIKTTRSLRKIGGGGVSAAGKLSGNEKFGLGVSTPRDMVTILERLERGKLVSAEASKEMIAVLKRCHDDLGMRRKLYGTPIANKTGALDALRSDAGIVYAKKGRVAMAITVDGMPSYGYTPDNPGLLLIADLAKMIVDGLTSSEAP